jgi:RNA polymerase sigma-70 factor (ECF subfamily)
MRTRSRVTIRFLAALQYRAARMSVREDRLRPSYDDALLLAALRAGDERAFAELVDRYGPAMRRLALTFVRTPAVADDVVQETWLGVLRGIDRFEGRSSLKTWLFRILTNTAKTRGERESRSVPFSSLAGELGEDGPAVDPDRFVEGGAWTSPPERWDALPESRLLAGELREVIDAAIADLPAAQRIVISLRDVEGWPADEARNVLGVSETNQRVLLHRARSKVRAALEDYVREQA